MDGKALLFEYWGAFGSGDIERLARLFHPDYVDNDLKTGKTRNLNDIKPAYLMWRSAFSDESEQLIHFEQMGRTIS